MYKRGREGGRKKQVQREEEKKPWVIEPLSRCLVQGRGECAENEQEAGNHWRENAYV